MKNVKFIYNPKAGENPISGYLDDIVKLYQEAGYTIIPYRLDFKAGHSDVVSGLDDSYHHILVAGGDGSLNYVINELQKAGIDIPVAIIPAGTANDFAKMIGMPNDPVKAARLILDGKTSPVDLGRIGDSYFINVFACGIFTEVSQRTPTIWKNTFGRIAYFFSSLSEVPKMRKLHMKITSDGGNYEGNCLLFLVFNGRTAGQMRMATKSEMDDGLLDVLILKGERTLFAFAHALTHLALGRMPKLKPANLNLDEIVYFQCSTLTAECATDESTDIDGQTGPGFPMTIDCLKHAQRIILPLKKPRRQRS